MDAVHRWPRIRRRSQPHRDVNAPNDEHAVICFHLARNVGRESPAAGIDLTRLQRASKRKDSFFLIAASPVRGPTA